MFTMNHAGQQYNVSYYQQHYKSQTELTCSYDLDPDTPKWPKDSQDVPIPAYQKRTFQVNAFKSYRFTNRHTDVTENMLQ